MLARRIVYELEIRRTREDRPPQQKSSSCAGSTAVCLHSFGRRTIALFETFCKGHLHGVDFPFFLPPMVQALRLCHQHDGVIDLTVRDIVMPQLNSLQMTKQIRAARPKMKFLFITVYADEFPTLHEVIKNGRYIWKNHSFLQNSQPRHWHAGMTTFLVRRGR
jgi:CheY-like chemotaxis protein